MTEPHRPSYDDRHRIPCLATVSIIAGSIVATVIAFCFMSYDVGIAGMIGLAIMIVGTVMETWASNRSLKFPKKAKKKQLVIYPTVTCAGIVTYVVSASIKRKWTHLTKMAIFFQCLFVVASIGVAVWAFALPRRRHRNRRNNRAERAARALEPPPLEVSPQIEKAPEVIKVDAVVKEEEPLPHEESDDCGIASNLPVGEPVEFPEGAFDSGSDGSLDVF